MSLILRAHVALAAQHIVPSWPLDSFIAVNPLAGKEAFPFDSPKTAESAMTRTCESYLAEFTRGRITSGDLEQAVLERTPELAGIAVVGTESMPAARIAALDMQLTVTGADPTFREAEIDPIDARMSTWVAAYLSPDPLWTMPHRADGFYRSWKALARFDRSLPRSARRMTAELLPEPERALAHALEHFEVADDAIAATLQRELAFLPGWVAYIKWRAAKKGDIDLTTYLAVRFSLRVLLDAPPKRPPETTEPPPPAVSLWNRASQVARHVAGDNARTHDVAMVARILAVHAPRDHAFTWQKAYELNYRNSLIDSLAQSKSTPETPQYQVVMCIDPRSEGMRRHLETDHTLETVGFAGFFGVPIRFSRYQARGSINSLPALLDPRHHITERPLRPEKVQKNIRARRLRDALRSALHAAESHTTTPFVLAEIAGWLFGAASAIRTFAPALAGRLETLANNHIPELDSEVTVSEAFTLDERVALAETAIRMMGLTQFAPLVVIAGHTSESANNLYQSALDCGACGGNPGAANARAAVAIFNDAEVRSILQRRGISIPEDCIFVAAEHNTVTDMMVVLDSALIPATHTERVRGFGVVQRRAADQLLHERAHELPGASSRSTSASLRRRAYDWSEVYPELGLAGNAAMIIGPRELTRGVDLRRRVFLHSYRPELDDSNTALETILTAPMVVAQWINHQYYFSSLHPETLGAGTKTIHNAIGVAGVLSGQEGDLRRGLPWQSVGFGQHSFHEPMRLAVLVQAPLKNVGEIISRNQVLRDLVDNDWITVTARENSRAPWYRHTSFGWKKYVTIMEGSRP
ncbi:DUF2309 domain-containing protein [Rhodoglobus aureus]|uniref:Probable inorganic carbon transporter subunit DabA n=1 Tax=Rhodoglobus aureus TaxID=191497 RepID=A0ABN1VZN2_9MICO